METQPIVISGKLGQLSKKNEISSNSFVPDNSAHYSLNLLKIFLPLPTSSCSCLCVSVDRTTTEF